MAYRVKWLQHRRIIIDPARTPNAYREFTNYSYEADKDGNFLPSLSALEGNTIAGNGGAIVDVLLNVHGETTTISAHQRNCELLSAETGEGIRELRMH